MKFEIKNRWTGDIQFTAEITCDENAAWGIKVGLAIKWARKNNAVLSGADLSGADLRNADLSGAVLSGADLRNAVLRNAVLRNADLSDIRADFLSEVLKLPNELEFLRDALIQGKVDGSTYTGECACLAGTLAHARGLTDYSGGPITNGCTFQSSADSPRERFFLAIKKGDTPATNSASQIALDWTNEAIAIRDNIRAVHTV